MLIKSERAKKLLEGLQFVQLSMGPSMRKYPGLEIKLWAALEQTSGHVKNLSFFGELDPLEKLILETLGKLIVGKPITRLDSLTFRECEAFLRDRNSEPAIEGWGESHEEKFKKVFQWLRHWPLENTAEEYVFPYEKGPFRGLKLVDKIRELKAFLASSQILNLYKKTARPELVDVEDLTVYVQVPYNSEEEKSLFHELHEMGVVAFQEENLNFIPEV